MENTSPQNQRVSRYHEFQSALLDVWRDADALVESFIRTYHEQCADILTYGWVESIAYCLVIRDRGFSMEDIEDRLEIHDIRSKAQRILDEFDNRSLRQTKEAKEIGEMFNMLHR